MFVVHGLWSVGSGLCLWAEDTARASVSRAEGRRRGATEHPFTVAPEILRAALGQGVGAQRDPVTMLLPTAGSRPVPSPGARVGADTRRSRAVPRLEPWQVPVVAVPAAAALDVLLARPGAGSGDDLADGEDGPVVL
ncbi:MAG: hypothetical protein ACRDV9_10710, partial [Acidimicrobiia bacterium]